MDAYYDLNITNGVKEIYEDPIEIWKSWKTKPEDLGRLRLGTLGEPTKHPDFSDFLRVIKSYKPEYITDGLILGVPGDPRAQSILEVTEEVAKGVILLRNPGREKIYLRAYRALQETGGKIIVGVVISGKSDLEVFKEKIYTEDQEFLLIPGRDINSRSKISFSPNDLKEENISEMKYYRNILLKDNKVIITKDSINLKPIYIYMTDFEKYFLSKHPYGRSSLDSVMKSASYMNPYILEERQLNVTQMDVFSRLMMDRIIFLGTEVTPETCNTINAQLLYLDSVEPGKDISLYINSPGGSVYDGLSVIDTMDYISSPVATICTGMAASMGAMLLVSGGKGKRMALPHSRVMIHQPLGGCRGQASDIEIEAAEIRKIKDELYQIISDRSGQSLEKVWKDADRDYWMTAQEAKDYGMIDTVLKK